MLSIFDFKVDEGDDLIILGDDFASESDSSVSAFRCGERRCQSRQDDFIMTPEICAGIETMIQSYINDYTLGEIERKISSSLQYHNLFSNTEFKVYINQDELDYHKLKVLVAFTSSSLFSADSNYTFHITVNLQNQRAFR